LLNEAVTVRFLYYENRPSWLRSAHGSCWSLALEGKFSDSGLLAMDDGADALTTRHATRNAMPRSSIRQAFNATSPAVALSTTFL
jgi:hypothetical protein